MKNKDFLDEIMEERTKINPDFPQMIEDASAPYVDEEYPLSELEKQVEDILGFWENFRKELDPYLEILSTEQLEVLSDYFCNGIHEPCHGFRCTMFDEIADLINAEIKWRPLWQESREYMDANPGKGYCFSCKKQCNSEEEHDAIFFNSYIPEPKEHKKFDEMSRDELLVLIKLMTPIKSNITLEWATKTAQDCAGLDEINLKASRPAK